MKQKKRVVLLTLMMLFMLSMTAYAGEVPKSVREKIEVHEELRDVIYKTIMVDPNRKENKETQVDALVDFVEYSNRPVSSDSGYKEITMKFQILFNIPIQEELMNGKYFRRLFGLWDYNSGQIMEFTNSGSDYETMSLPIDGEEKEIRYSFTTEEKKGYYKKSEEEQFYYKYCHIVTFKAEVPENHGGFGLMFIPLQSDDENPTWGEITENPDIWSVRFGIQEDGSSIIHNEALDRQYRTDGYHYYGRSNVESTLEGRKKEEERNRIKQKQEAILQKVWPIFPVLFVLSILLLPIGSKRVLDKRKSQVDDYIREIMSVQERNMEQIQYKADSESRKIFETIADFPAIRQKLYTLAMDPNASISDINYGVGSYEVAQRLQTLCKKQVDKVCDKMPKSISAPLNYDEAYEMIAKARSAKTSSDRDNYNTAAYNAMQNADKWSRIEMEKILEEKAAVVFTAGQQELMEEIHSLFVRNGIPKVFPDLRCTEVTIDYGPIKGTKFKLFPNDYCGRKNLTEAGMYLDEVNQDLQVQDEPIKQELSKVRRYGYNPPSSVGFFAIPLTLLYVFYMFFWLSSIYYHFGGTELYTFEYHDTIWDVCLALVFVFPQLSRLLPTWLFLVLNILTAAIAIAGFKWLTKVLSKKARDRYYNRQIKTVIDARMADEQEILEKLKLAQQAAEEGRARLESFEEYQLARKIDAERKREDQKFLRKWVFAWKRYDAEMYPEKQKTKN